MSTHLENILQYIPDLTDRHILDLGSGAGGFLIDCAKHGYNASGLELNPDKIKRSLERAGKENVLINITKGEAENLPFEDCVFDFVNVSEVIEHVKDPKKVLSEIYRVMSEGGFAYVSAHNRFGLYDTHFHIYFLGLIPRFLGEKYINLLNKSKNYENMPDFQRISDMHYYTFGNFKNLAGRIGFKVSDIRENKIRRVFDNVLAPMIVILYRLFLRPLYFSAFHVLLRK